MGDGSNQYYCYEDIILDEVALEGLDGITVEALWLRLETNQHWKLKPLDDDVKRFVWSIITKYNEIEWYKISKDRPLPHIGKMYFDTADEDCEYMSNDHVYPFSLVSSNGVRGSCSEFSTRVNVSDFARNLSFEEMYEKFISNIVAVASQEKRESILLPQEFNRELELSDLSYCMLEKIARTRYDGCISLFLKCMKGGAKPAFYYWNQLHNLNLITVQTFTFKKQPRMVSCKVLHLPVFYEKIPSKIEEYIIRIIDYLNTLPEKEALVSEVRSRLNLPKPNRIQQNKLFKENVISKNVPYRYLYPDAQMSEYLSKNGMEKSLRIFALKNQNENTIRSCNKKLEKLFPDALIRYRRELKEPIVSQVLRSINEVGIKGMSQREVSTKHGLNMLMSRAILKRLLKMDSVCFAVHENFRQKVFRYFSKQFDLSKRQEYDSLLQTAGNIIDDSEYKCTTNSLANGEINAKQNSCDKEIISQTKEISSETQSDNNCEIPEIKVEEPAVPLNSMKRKNTDEVEMVNSAEVKKAKYSLLNDHDIIAANSLRLVKRRNLILKRVYEEQVVYGYGNLIKYLKEEERKEGIVTNACRRSLIRIVDFFTNKNQLKVIQKHVKCDTNNRFKDLVFICRPDINEDHPVIQSLMQQTAINLSVKYSKYSRNKLADKKSNAKKTEDASTSIFASNVIQLQWSQGMGRKYGYGPKFYRMKFLHEVMYYIVYGYDGQLDLKQDETKSYLQSMSYGPFKEYTDLPQIYTPEISWKMFIPPLKGYDDYGEGWVSCIDLILRLPLFIFLSVVNISYPIPGVEEYLEDRIRKNLLFEQLPVEIRDILTAERRFVHEIMVSLRNLCRIGLLQFGGRQAFDSTSCFVYLNKKTQLINTTKINSRNYKIQSNTNCPRIMYQFKTCNDVEKYWNDAMSICLSTKLIRVRSLNGKQFLYDMNVKPSIKKALKPRLPHEVADLDTGEVPGDHRGAAGYDSLLLAHLPSVWIKRQNEIPQTALIREKVPTEKTDKKRTVVRNNQNKFKTVNNNKSKKNVIPKSWKRPAVSNLPKLRKRRLEYDKTDLDALDKMYSQRSMWSREEDNILLLGYVAHLYVKCVPMVYLYYVKQREILHKLLPYARDKTSEAVRRRMKILVRDSFNKHCIYLCLKDLQEDAGLDEMFRDKMERIRKYYAKKKYDSMHKIMDSLFVVIFNILHGKFPDLNSYRANSNDQNEEIPKSLKEFKERFDYEYLSDVTRIGVKHSMPICDENDAICSVISSLIFSSLLCQKEMGKRDLQKVYELGQIFKQFSESNLKKTFSFVRKARMLAFNKPSTKISNLSTLPFGGGTYHLSITYHLLFRTHFDVKVCNEAYEMYKKLLCTSSERPLVLQRRGLGSVIALAAYLYNQKIDFYIDPSVLSNDTSVILDCDESNLTAASSKQMGNCDITELFSQGGDEKNSVEASHQNEDKNRLTINQRDNYASACPQTSQEGDSNLSDYLDTNCEEVNYDEENDDSDDTFARKHGTSNYKELELSIRRKKQLKDGENTFSNFRTEILPLRCYLNSEDESCILLKDDVRELVNYKIEGSTIFKGNELSDEEIISNISNRLQKNEVVQVRRLLKFIFDKDQLGASNSELRENFSLDFLQKGINYISEYRAVLRSGTTETRYVHREFCDCWLMKYIKVISAPCTSNKERIHPESTSVIRVLMRPWVRTDGTVNRHILNAILVRVLMFIIEKTGVPLSRVQERFMPALEPAYTFELIDILKHLGTINLIHIYKKEEVTAFSKMDKRIQIKDATGFESEEDISIQAMPNALMKMSIFVGGVILKNDVLSIK